MALLKDILYGVSLREVIGSTEISVVAIEFDSRKVDKNSLFIAIRGTVVDGHDYIESAIEKGATAIILEDLPVQKKDGISYLRVEDSAAALAITAANYYDNPSRKLQLIGITGTNGKTTSATLLYKMFRKMGHSVGLISTISYYIDDTVYKATHTTPDALYLNMLLAEMVAQGCQYCFMEVSSHAVAQRRIEGLNFLAGIFTNITHDHLDFHITFKDYLKAKKAFFDGLPQEAFALINADDKNGSVMVQNTSAKVSKYGLKSVADFKAKVLENSFDGLKLIIDNQEIHSLLIGEFNAYNLLSVYALAILLGKDKMEVLTHLSALRTADGRFDHIRDDKRNIVGIVDYAHTPDALEKVLETVQNIRTGNESLITIIGAGGDRDKTKRPLMAKVAAKMSNKVILTSDNPRSEDPMDIINQMEEGVEISNRSKVLTIPDRKEAIKTARMLASNGDIILLCGKGHETYQEIKGERLPFDDKEILSEIFKSYDD